MNNEILDLLNVTSLINMGTNGKGVKVAVIDTGVNDIPNKLTVKGGYNCNTRKEENYNDSNGHGTNVASLISGKETGVAPNCELYSIKYEGIISEELVTSIIYGLRWCIENKMDIVNMSFGFTIFDSNEFQIVCKEAIDNGVILVAAAGNNSLNSIIGIPAAYNSVISVSSITKNNLFSASSSWGNNIDFCCYGESVPSYDLNGNIVYRSGTSFSAPYISGIIALLKEQNLSLTHREIYEILKGNCYDLGLSGKDRYYGYGLVKAFTVPTIYKKEAELKQIESERNIYFPFIKLKVEIGTEVDSRLNFIPEDSKVKLDYKVTESNIAVVDQNGIVTGLTLGTTNLIATYGNKVSVCEIEVIEKQTKPEESINTFNLKELNIPDLHDKGINGKGVKIAILGYGCIDSPNIRIKQFVDLTAEKKTGNNDANGFGTRLTSLISSPQIGVAPEADVYIVKIATIGGVVTYTDQVKGINWCIQNKMDIINYQFEKNDSTSEALLKKCFDNNIICIANAGGLGDLTKRIPTLVQKSPYSVTVSYVTDKKEFIGIDAFKTPNTGDFIDCCCFGYGMTCINSSDKFEIYDSNTPGIYMCNVAMMQVMGVIALLKQQNTDINNAVKVRALLPSLCEDLLATGKDIQTGYGLIKAKNF
jgi:minor extracellular protease Epr